MTSVGQIRRATEDDLATVTDILTAAFLDGDLAPWLIADPHERAAVYPHYFAIFAEHFIDYGTVDVLDDAAVAVWYPVGNRFDPQIPDYDRRLQQACGPHTFRFQRLDHATDTLHPVGAPHAYLGWLAVHPNRQGRGLGSHLLKHRHRLLDRAGQPAYLEATSDRLRSFYRRHGYDDCGPPTELSTTAALRPMWRPAAAGRDEIPPAPDTGGVA